MYMKKAGLTARFLISIFDILLKYRYLQKEII